MENLCLKIMNKNMEALAVARGEDEVNLVYAGEYQDGDIIILEVSEGCHYVWLQWDDAAGKSLIYITGNVTYRIPFGDRRVNLSPRAFTGGKHLLTAKLAKDFEINYYRNMAYNVCDQHEIEHLYPHATANVETRGEAVFAAQNAIDGITVSNCHGEWPYQSWGINRQEDARIRIDFGREILADTVVIYLRTDFPHDNWWQQVSLEFSDGSRMDVALQRMEGAQKISIGNKKITWLEMCDMKKSAEISPFPALTQIEVYGTESVDKEA